MKLIIPKFWSRKGFISYLLYPISLIYYFISIIYRSFSIKNKVNAKIICVGNVTLGGAGKTPIAISIVKYLLSKNLSTSVVSRGYKGFLSNNHNVILIDNNIHTFKDVGDEAILLSRYTKTYISASKELAITKAVNDGANYIIMDDGIQNQSIYKDLNILVIDAEYNIGNGMLFPSGPLRETLKSALKKTDIIIITVIDRQVQKLSIDKLNHLIKKNNFLGYVTLAQLEVINRSQIINKTFIAVCGIAIPDKFFKTLDTLNINIAAKFIFQDHHIFTEKELFLIYEVAAKKDSLCVITTSKDLTRIPKKYYDQTIVLEIEYHIKEEILLEISS